MGRDRYKVVNCTWAQPVSTVSGAWHCGKVISVTVLSVGSRPLPQTTRYRPASIRSSVGREIEREVKIARR